MIQANKQCPKCGAGASSLYRKNPHSLVVNCQQCGICWQVDQPSQPFLKRVFCISRNSWIITVWCNPADCQKYSFAICFNNSLPVKFNEYPIDWMSGCYQSINEAEDAAIAYIRNEVKTWLYL